MSCTKSYIGLCLLWLLTFGALLAAFRYATMDAPEPDTIDALFA